MSFAEEILLVELILAFQIVIKLKYLETKMIIRNVFFSGFIKREIKFNVR